MTRPTTTRLALAFLLLCFSTAPLAVDGTTKSLKSVGKYKLCDSGPGLAGWLEGGGEIWSLARAIDRQIILVGGAALALNAALSATGGGSYIAGGLITALDGASAAIMLSAFFLLVAIFTNLLSNNACAVLFTPIGINIALGLDINPVIFVVAVILAANCSFASPIGYVTNLLVMAPGRYRFSDFVRAGSPLVLLLWVGFSLFAPWYYGLW